MRFIASIILLSALSHAGYAQDAHLSASKDTIRTFFPARMMLSATFINGSSNNYAVPPDFHTRNFGFFCRQELKMQQAHIPLTFRLGSMEYCNRMEQKPGYR